ncbi:MAG: glutamine--fructose-6-phosphate transaminase (isomerizing) [Candidatus Pacebacteria bacterium]|nr:glutamine--fructose-6-phosphate transaminase (isomerizing) [Candidatus Paceibacterota bacterium]
MCGIVGYVGENNATPFLLKGLKRLEYRGYDSSGIAVLGEEIGCVKEVGKIEKLEEEVSKNELKGSIGIGHSRWATHGGVTEENAHPHWDCEKNIFVVHNGIVENYKEIKNKLIKRGHKFVSDTDTEVIAHLIEHFFKGDLESAVKKALRIIKGTYGLVVIAKKDPGKMVAARMFSPLVISVNDKGSFVASDPSAIITHSKKMIFLEDGDVAVIQKDNFVISDIKEKIKEREEVTLDWDIEDSQKNGYPHFMIKEIAEQPESITNSMRGRIVLEEGSAKLGGLELVEEELKNTKKISIIACGTSYYAGITGKYLIEEFSGVPVEVSLASEFRYRKKVIEKDETFIFISQSGETADTLAALQEVKKKDVLTLGIVNAVGSSIARETDAGVYNHAGPEIGVASTKAFTSQVVVLSLIALFLGRQRNLSLEEGKEVANTLLSLPSLVSEILKDDSEIKEVAEKYKDFKNFFFIGRRYGYPASLEGSLKLKEISYIHSEGYPAGELKHGPIALIDESFPTVAICLSNSVYEKMVSNVEEIKARNGRVIVLANRDKKDVKELTEDVIYLPTAPEFVSPVLAVVCFQLFSYYVSVSLGRDPDKPRNLAKSVTVE